MANSVRGLWLAFAFTIGTACVRPASAEVAKPAGSQAAAPAKKKLGPLPDKQTSAKVNSYIELMNAESNHVYSMREALFKAIDPKVGPTCKEYVFLEQEIGPNGGKYDEYRKTIKAKPPLKPDAAALKMVDAVEDLWKLGGEKGPHGPPPRGPADEWCTRIKLVFPRYVAAFDKYAEGKREVSAYVENFTDERDLREVDSTLKKYGKHYRYQFASLNLEGKLLMRAVRAEIAKGAPDSAALRERFTSYFALADETLAMMKKDPKAAQGDAYPTSFYFFLVESMPKLKRASDDLLALLAEKPGKDFTARLDRKWGALVDAYNEIVGYGNQIEWSSKQK